jgi:starch phosphorylase
VGDENILIFGMKTPEVLALQKHYNPHEYYNNNAKLRRAVDFIANGIGGKQFPDLVRALRDSDYYMAFADFEDYCSAQSRASELYNKSDVWNRMSLYNIANAGCFSSDRSIDDYAKTIWNAKPLEK